LLRSERGGEAGGLRGKGGKCRSARKKSVKKGGGKVGREKSDSWGKKVHPKRKKQKNVGQVREGNKSQRKETGREEKKLEGKGKGEGESVFGSQMSPSKGEGRGRGGKKSRDWGGEGPA